MHIAWAMDSHTGARAWVTGAWLTWWTRLAMDSHKDQGGIGFDNGQLPNEVGRPGNYAGLPPSASGISCGGMPVAQGLSLRNAQRMRQNLPTDTRWPGNSKNITCWPGHSGNKEPALCTLHNIRRALRLWMPTYLTAAETEETPCTAADSSGDH
jgi:hypothetical protein